MEFLSVSFSRKIRQSGIALSRYLSAMSLAPTPAQARGIFAIAGLLVLVLGLNESVTAIGSTPNLGAYNDTRIAEFTNRVFGYIEGSMGALIMVAAGLGAIISAAFGQYRASLALLVVAVGAFILRSLVATFFNDAGIQ